MKKSKIDSKLYQLTLEKMVIGLEEPILIKGVGEIIAKIDSGNGGYNVIHGEDLTVQGDILTFKTINKDGDDRRVSKKIKETINVNIGGGHVQERPVIELDVQFGGQDYKKVLFSVTDRSGNDNKVLISKDFVGKELEALIDVTKSEIADDGVEVEYVSEGVLNWAADKVKDAGNAIKNAPRRAADAVGFKTDVKSNVKKDVKVNGEQTYKVKSNKQRKGSWIDRFYDASQRFKKWVVGSGSLFDDIEEFFTGPELLEKFLKADADVVRKALLKESDIINKLGGDSNSIQVYKILDFLGGCCAENKYVKEQEIEEKRVLKDKLKKAQKEIEALEKEIEKAEGKKSKEGAENEDDASANADEEIQDTETDDTEENEEVIIKEADETPAAGAPATTTPAAGDNESTDAATEGNAGEGFDKNKDPQAQIEDLTKQVEAAKQELTKYKEVETGRDFFVIYYAAFTKTAQGETLADGQKIVTGNPEQAVLQSGPEVMDQKINDAVVKTFVEKLAPDMGKNNSRGVFVYCTGSNIPRKANIIKDVLVGVPENDGKQGNTKASNVSEEELEQFVNQYKEISDKIMAIADDLGQEHDEVDEEYINTLIELAGGEATERSPEMQEFIQQYSQLNDKFHAIADDMVSSEQMLDEQLINDLIEMANEFNSEKLTDEAQNDPGDQGNDQAFYDLENNVENEEQPIK